MACINEGGIIGRLSIFIRRNDTGAINNPDNGMENNHQPNNSDIRQAWAEDSAVSPEQNPNINHQFTPPDRNAKNMSADEQKKKKSELEASIEELTDKLLDIKVNFMTINEISQDIKINYDAVQDSMYELLYCL